MLISDRLEQTLKQVDGAIKSAISTSTCQGSLILGALEWLTKLENRPWRLTEMAYAWCAAIWENRHCHRLWKGILFLSLNVGFRNFDPLNSWYRGDLTHTESHRGLAVEVFKIGEREAITDLLYALTISHEDQPLVHSLGICKQYIVDLPSCIATPFSPRLRRLLLGLITYTGVNGFEEAGVENFVSLVNSPGAMVEERDLLDGWGPTLLDVIQSPGARRHLALQSWELLTRLTLNSSWWGPTSYTSGVTVSLSDEQEWDKLECWLIVVMVLWHQRIDDDTGVDLECAMESLFRQRPCAVQKLTKWMKQCECGVGVLETFERICKRAREAMV